jgi:phosphinothricin acetyltransferase
MKVRHAEIADIKRIVDIYNQAVDEQFCTADTEHITIQSRSDWLNQHSPDHYPLFVAIHEHQVAGWCCLSPYRPGRKALRRVAEISYYFDRKFRGQGFARELVEHVIEEARRLNFEHLIAILLDRNHASIRLLENFDFAQWGHLPDIAHFAEAVCGQYIYGRKL